MVDRGQSHTSGRGFASMDEKKQRDIASRGGQASGGNFKNDPERAAAAGRKGGQSVPAEERSFSRDHRLAAEAGRKGGEHSHGGRNGGPIGSGHQASRQPSRDDRKHDHEAGRLGGEYSNSRR